MKTIVERRAKDAARKRVNYWVDHIVPLQSTKVCGLHVETNLRVVPAVVNTSKGNRYWPNMEGWR